MKNLITSIVMAIIISLQLVIMYATYNICEPIRHYNENNNKIEMEMKYCPYCGQDTDWSE